MANPNDAHDRAFYNAEMRPVVRALIGTLYARVQEARSIATDPVIERSEKFRRIESLNIGVDTQFHRGRHVVPRRFRLLAAVGRDSSGDRPQHD
jgi:hypothetical protein